MGFGVCFIVGTALLVLVHECVAAELDDYPNYDAESDSPDQYIDNKMTIAANSTAILKCSPSHPDFQNAQWLVNGTHRQLTNSISSNGANASVLTIFDVTQNDTGEYLCRKSPNLIERLHLNVHTPVITISDRKRIFIRNGGTFNLTCTVVAVESPDVITWYFNGTAIETDQTQWQSKNRICMSEGTENCLIRTTFNFISKGANSRRSGVYSCATDNIQPATVFVEELSAGTTVSGNLRPWDINTVMEYATEALELYGTQQAAADYVTDKCNAHLSRTCICLLAPSYHVYSIPQSYFSHYLKFRIGSISFSVLHTD